VKELHRIAKLGFRTVMLNAIAHNRMSYGNATYDPIWEAAQDLDISVGIHIANCPEFVGFQWYQDHKTPQLLFPGMCSFLGPRMALTTMMIDGVFERFPKLRVATLEARVGWVPEWIELMERYCQYAMKGTKMKRPPREYFGTNIWVSGDADESMFGPAVRFIGDDAFLVGSDYPHVEGSPQPMVTARETLSGQSLGPATIGKILVDNGCKYLGIEA
jgi:predicted TIM-barrel fold metal-dependent hydrolase